MGEGREGRKQITELVSKNEYYMITYNRVDSVALEGLFFALSEGYSFLRFNVK